MTVQRIGPATCAFPPRFQIPVTCPRNPNPSSDPKPYRGTKIVKHSCLRSLSHPGFLATGLVAVLFTAGVAIAAGPYKSEIDYGCNANQRLVTFAEIDRSGSDQGTKANLTAFGNAACAIMSEWDILRLSGGGSMGGSGYDCHHFTWDERSLGGSLCVAYTAISISNAQTCGASLQLMTVQEAQARLEEIKPLLGPDIIARLADGGSISGSAYDNEIFPSDTRSLGNAVCTAMAQ